MKQPTIVIYGTDQFKINTIIKLLEEKNLKYSVEKKIKFAGNPCSVIDNLVWNYTQTLYYIKHEL